MVWKLTRFELKKALCSKFFAIMCCLLLTVNVALSCDNWKNFGNPKAVTDTLREEYELINGLTQQERSAFEAAMIEKYGEDVFSDSFFPMGDMLEELMRYPGYFGQKFCDLDIIFGINGLRRTNRTNEDWREYVISAAKSLGREALKEGDSYGVRRNLSIIKLYSQTREELTNQCTWNIFFLNDIPVLLSLLLILQICAGIFTKETDQQTWILLHTSKNGMGKTMAAKFLAAALSSVGIALLFSAVNLLVVYLDIGLLGISQPVTVIQELYLFPYAFTVGQAMALFTLCRMFAVVLMAVLLCTISALSRSSVVSYSIGAVVLGGAAAMAFYLPRTEWLAGPLALIFPLRFFNSFYTANIFGFPVLWAIVQAILWTALAAVSVSVSHKVYHRKRRKI